MISVTRLKKSNRIVYPVGAAGSNHTTCILPVDRLTKKGNRAHLINVRNDNLKTDREELF